MRMFNASSTKASGSLGFPTCKVFKPLKKVLHKFHKIRMFALDNGGRWKDMQTSIALPCTLLQVSIVGCALKNWLTSSLVEASIISRLNPD